MNNFDIFPYFWLSGVLIFGVVSSAWAINDLKVGSARMGQWSKSRVSRVEEPFEFWLAVGGKFIGSIVACFMFYFGLDMLTWS